jgi:hypothetical protein
VEGEIDDEEEDDDDVVNVATVFPVKGTFLNFEKKTHPAKGTFSFP